MKSSESVHTHLVPLPIVISLEVSLSLQDLNPLCYSNFRQVTLLGFLLTVFLSHDCFVLDPRPPSSLCLSPFPLLLCLPPPTFPFSCVSLLLSAPPSSSLLIQKLTFECFCLPPTLALNPQALPCPLLYLFSAAPLFTSTCPLPPCPCTGAFCLSLKGLLCSRKLNGLLSVFFPL